MNGGALQPFSKPSLSQRGLGLIMDFEGFSPTMYRDVAGLLTIGYGHLLTPSEVKRFEGGVSQDEAVALLKADVAHAEGAVDRLITTRLTQGQYDALVSFTFNLGSGALQRSTLRRKVNRGEHEDVPGELLRWVWAGGRKRKGLVRRRKAEARLYLYSSDLLPVTRHGARKAHNPAQGYNAQSKMNNR